MRSLALKAVVSCVLIFLVAALFLIAKVGMTETTKLAETKQTLSVCQPTCQLACAAQANNAPATYQ